MESCGLPTILSSTDLSPKHAAENVLSICEEGKFWRAPVGMHGSEAEIVIDLMCKQSVHSMQILNGFGDFGTQSFTLMGSRTTNGPWIKIKDAELPNLTNTVNLKVYQLIDFKVS